MSSDYPSLKAKRLLRLLESLGYVIVSTNGSHRKLRCEEHPPLTFAFHDKIEVPSRIVKKILTKDVGLTDEEARSIL